MLKIIALKRSKCLTETISSYIILNELISSMREKIMKIRKVIPFNEIGCFNCKNFYQHYVFGRGGYTTTNCGHCCKYKDVYPDKSYKKCQYYEEYTLKEKREIKKAHSKELIERIDKNLSNLMHYLKK